MKATVPEESRSDLVTLETSQRSKPKRIVLVGQPNVGKSLIFSELTARYVTVSNFPGTTVEVFRGQAKIEDQEFEILDTPGINGISAASEDERATLRILEQEQPDVIVQVADAKNLRRALLLTTALTKLDRPLVLVLNMMDECRDKGIVIDVPLLSQKLSAPVIETIATVGSGIDQLKRVLLQKIPNPVPAPTSRTWVEGILASVQEQQGRADQTLSLKTKLFMAASLAGVLIHLQNYVGGWLNWPTWETVVETFFASVGLAEPLVISLKVVLGSLIPVLLPVLWAIRSDSQFNERFGAWSRKVVSGSLILAVTLSLTFQLVGNLGAQVFVEALEGGLFDGFLTPLLRSAVPAGFFYDLLVGEYGLISMGLAYGVAIVLPVVSTFFIAFSFLEDSGYLPRLSILSDRILRAMGLHGKAFLPMVLGLGCVTMATMTTRILSSKKERFIATLLLALGVPCSAQLGVILAITSGLSFSALLLVFGTVGLQLIIVGFALSRIYPGDRSSFILELPPIRCPVWSNILRKTYWRVAWFLKEAVPLFVLGTFVLFVLDKLNLLQKIVRFMEPLVNRAMGLPNEAAAVFLMGFLRRDYGAAGLFDLFREGRIDGVQTVVGLVVITLFVPCIANSFVLVKEQGVRNAVAIVSFILVYALGVGILMNWLLHTLQVTL